MSLSRGRSRSTLRRLCSRAPCTTSRSFTAGSLRAATDNRTSVRRERTHIPLRCRPAGTDVMLDRWTRPDAVVDPPARAHRGLRRPRRRAGPPRWCPCAARSTGCACRRSTRPPASPRLLGDARARPVAPHGPRRDARDAAGTSDDSFVLETTYETAHGHRRRAGDDAAQRRPGRPGAAARLHPGRRSRSSTSGSCGSATAPSSRGCGTSPTTPGSDAIRAIAGPGLPAAARRPPAPGRRPPARRPLHARSEGESVELALTWTPLVGPGPAAPDHRGPHRLHPDHAGACGRAAARTRAPTARPWSGRCWSCACSPTRRPAASSRPPPRRCRRTSAGSATGTTGTAGCGTRR